jgi:hypothetical protein
MVTNLDGLEGQQSSSLSMSADVPPSPRRPAMES